MMLFYILLVVLLAVFIYTLSGECPVKYMLGVGGAGYVILIWVFLGFVAGIFALIFSFAHVFVDEQGVRVSSGKLKIRNYSWEDVKRIEFCEIQCRNGAFPVVLVSKKDQNNSVSGTICWAECLPETILFFYSGGKQCSCCSSTHDVPSTDWKLLTSTKAHNRLTNLNKITR